MRIVLHDYAGHPFQVQLARELARRGHEVHHLYFSEDVTPRGALGPRDDDPACLLIEGIATGRPFNKHNYIARVRGEWRYGGVLADRIEALAPDVLICANTPVAALAQVRRRTSCGDRLFIIWLQDVLSIGIRRVFKKKLPFAGDLVGRAFEAVERRNLLAADRIVCITEDFLPILEEWGIERDRCTVIENWAPLDELAPYKGPMSWVREHGLAGKRLALYAGTLGLKHNPRLLASAARALAVVPGFEDVALVVVSEGPGAEFLKAEKASGRLDNLALLPFQPYERMAEVLASADLVLAVLEPEAGIFAVPSKVLSYLCAGRPVLMAAPLANLASRTVMRTGAGRVVAPDDEAGFVRELMNLLDDPEARRQMGRGGRAHALEAFAIDGIADRFEALWEGRPAARFRLAAE